MFTKIIKNTKKMVRSFFEKFVPENHSQMFFGSVLFIIVFSAVGFFPLVGVDGLFIKHLLLPIFTSIVLIIIAGRALKHGYFTLPERKISWGIFALLGVLLLSSLFASAPRNALFGTLGIAPSFALILSLFIIFYIASIAIKNISRVFGVLVTIASVFVVVFIHQVLRLIFGPTFLSFGFMNNLTTSLLGSWTDFALWSFLMVVFAVICLEIGKFVRAGKWITLTVGVLGVIGLFITNIFWVWALTGTVAIFISIYIFSLAYWNPEKSSYDKGRVIPWYGLAVFVLVLVGILFGGLITRTLSTIRPVFYNEIAPSYTATFRAGIASIKDSPLLGIGMNNFDQVWNMTKPESLSGTYSGTLEFPSGHSFITNQLATTGILGMIAWLGVCFLFLRKYFLVIKKGFHDVSDRFVKIIIFTGSVVLSAVVVIYAPGISVLVLWAAFSGALWGISEKKEEQISFIHDPRMSFFGIVTVLLLVIIGGSFIYVSVRKITSVVHYHRGLQALTVNNRSAGLEHLIQANQAWSTDYYNRLLARQVLQEVQNLKPGASVSQETLNREIERLLSIGLSYAEAAIRFDEHNHRNWVTIGNMYQLFGELKIEGSFDRARDAYQKAKSLSPNDRTLDLLLAELAVSEGNNEGAIQIVQTSLDTYPTTNAWLWFYQRNVATKNYTEAEKNLFNALRLDRTNSRIMSELGMIYFVQGKYSDAAVVFEQSIRLDRNQPGIFAYLGVSYESLGKTDQANQIYEFLRREIPASADRLIQTVKDQKNSPSVLESNLEPESANTAL